MSTTTQDVPKRVSSMEDFAVELNRVMPVVTRVARRFAPRGEAEDVTQEACMAAWRYRHRPLRAAAPGCCVDPYPQSQ